MALPSELEVSLAIRSPGFCGHCATASRSCPGKAGSGSLFASVQIGVPALSEAGRTKLKNQQGAGYRSDDCEFAFHCPLPNTVPAERHWLVVTPYFVNLGFLLEPGKTW